MSFRGVKKYLVQWSGSDENGDSWEPSWEPAKHIDTTSPALKDFLRKRTSATESEATLNSESNFELHAKKQKLAEKCCSEHFNKSIWKI